MYLLRAGANPHAASQENTLTPLDTFLRGCTRYQVDTAGRWIEVILKSGIDLYQYANEEQRIHGHEQYLTSTWDEELWRWIPTKRRVVYQYGQSLNQIEIWVEDYDALSWFRCGRYDLDIFQVCSPAESLLRWQQMNDHDDIPTITAGGHLSVSSSVPEPAQHRLPPCIQARLFYFLCLSLILNYVLHLLMTGGQ